MFVPALAGIAYTLPFKLTPPNQPLLERMDSGIVAEDEIVPISPFASITTEEEAKRRRRRAKRERENGRTMLPTIMKDAWLVTAIVLAAVQCW